MVNIGPGEEAAVKTGKPGTAASSASSRKNGNANTGKIRRVTQAQALQILQESLRVCADTGINIGIENNGANLIIGIQSVNLLDGWLIGANNGNE